MAVHLSATFTDRELEAVWGWMQQFPESNSDDYGPKDFEGFKDMIAKRLLHGVVYLGVWDRSTFIGMVGLMKINKLVWETCGVIFDKAVHGTGKAQEGFGLVLQVLRKAKAAKLSAKFFADNSNIRKFLTGFGFVDEGVLRKQTLRGGQPIDVAVMAGFLE